MLTSHSRSNSSEQFLFYKYLEFLIHKKQFWHIRKFIKFFQKKFFYKIVLWHINCHYNNFEEFSAIKTNTGSKIKEIYTSNEIWKIGCRSTYFLI